MPMPMHTTIRSKAQRAHQRSSDKKMFHVHSRPHCQGVSPRLDNFNLRCRPKTPVIGSWQAHSLKRRVLLPQGYWVWHYEGSLHLRYIYGSDRRQGSWRYGWDVAGNECLSSRYERRVDVGYYSLSTAPSNRAWLFERGWGVLHVERTGADATFSFLTVILIMRSNLTAWVTACPSSILGC